MTISRTPTLKIKLIFITYMSTHIITFVEKAGHQSPPPPPKAGWQPCELLSPCESPDGSGMRETQDAPHQCFLPEAVPETNCQRCEESETWYFTALVLNEWKSCCSKLMGTCLSENQSGEVWVLILVFSLFLQADSQPFSRLSCRLGKQMTEFCNFIQLTSPKIHN